MSDQRERAELMAHAEKLERDMKNRLEYELKLNIDEVIWGKDLDGYKFIQISTIIDGEKLTKQIRWNKPEKDIEKKLQLIWSVLMLAEEKRQQALGWL